MRSQALPTQPSPPEPHVPSAVHVTRGASYLIMQSLATNAVSIVTFAILARLITPSDMGVFAVLLLVSSVCQTFASLAIPSAATRFVAEELSQGRRRAAASAFYQALRATLIPTLILSCAIFLAAKPLASQLLGEPSDAIFFQIEAADMVVFAGPLPVLTSTMYGLQKFKETAVIGVVISTLFRQGLIIAFVILLQGLVGLVLAWVVSDAVAALAYFAYVLRALGRPTFDFELRKLLSFSLPLSLSSVASFAQSWFDRAVLVLFVPLATLGIYNATITAFTVLLAISQAMSTTLFPAYSAIQASDHGVLRTKAVRLASRYVNLVVVPLAFGLMATAKPALTLFVGAAYVGGATSLMILSATFALTVFVSTALGPMLLALAETKVAAAITIISVGVSLVAAFLLMPMYGMIGAAAARGLTMIVAAILTVAVLSRKMKLQTDLEATGKSLFASALMAVVVAAIQIPLYNKLLLPVYVLVGLVVYVLMLRLLKAVKQHDIDLIRDYLGHRLDFATNTLSWILL